MELEEWKSLYRGLENIPDKEVAIIRKEIGWMLKLIEQGKLVASDTVLMGYREAFRHKLQKLGILV